MCGVCVLSWKWGVRRALSREVAGPGRYLSKMRPGEGSGAINKTDKNPHSHEAYNPGVERKEKDNKYHQQDDFNECAVPWMK